MVTTETSLLVCSSAQYTFLKQRDKTASLESINVGGTQKNMFKWEFDGSWLLAICTSTGEVSQCVEMGHVAGFILLLTILSVYSPDIWGLNNDPALTRV